MGVYDTFEKPISIVYWKSAFLRGLILCVY